MTSKTRTLYPDFAERRAWGGHAVSIKTDHFTNLPDRVTGKKDSVNDARLVTMELLNITA